jgi:hypothetical protein
MESASNSGLSGESEQTAQSSISPILEDFKLTPEDVAVVKEYMGDFQTGDTDSHNKILD